MVRLKGQNQRRDRYESADAVHRFHTITDDIVVLVVFAPAEYSNEHIARIQAG
jgi:hypothetical protein